MEAFVSSIAVSTVDWPEKTCLVISLAGCNFKCPWCFVQKQLELKKEFLTPLRDVKKKIEENLHYADALLFTGGEPGLQRQAVLSIARFARMHGLQVGIETNGSKPETIKTLLFENLLDFIALDIKASFSSELFEEITHSATYFTPVEQHLRSLKETIKLLRSSSVSVEVRTTLLPQLDLEKMRAIAAFVHELHCRWILQPLLLFSLADTTYKQPIPSEKVEEYVLACQKEYPALSISVRET